MHREKKDDQKKSKMSMKTETDLKYKYIHITKGSIKKKIKHKYLKRNLNVLDISNDEVLYFKSEFFFDQNNW